MTSSALVVKSDELAAKPCHTCRRRRVTCDRAYPSCQKCKKAGQECLGYDKLFRWTHGVASRGKLASGTMTMFRTKADAAGAVEDDEKSPTPRTLVDPLFQDVESSHRLYLSYFSERLCLDLVSYDVPDRNPFRELVPLTKDHPLIFHTLVAVSAVHMSNTTRITTPQNREEVSRTLIHALSAKQTALQLLYKAVNEVGSVDGDIILAAVLFFIHMELIEFGKEEWAAHLEGAGKVMATLKPAGEHATALRDYMMADCLAYYVFSSAFKPSVTAKESYFHSDEFSSILKRTSANQYLCCPPEILQILLEATALSNNMADDPEAAVHVAEAAAKLVERALAVDVHVWACTIRNIPCFQRIPMESRIHVGSAHRLTACLYTLQAIPLAIPLVSVTPEELCAKIHDHLEFIPPDDVNYKATPWPTFVLSASATDPKIRKLAFGRFKEMVEHRPWGFLKTAFDTLQFMWNSTDAEELEFARNWVQMLREARHNFVFVC